MNIQKVRSAITRNILNIPGWRINRKIVVFESDDWGSIRIPSKEVFNRLQAKGVDMAINPFNKYDTLETEDDLIALFELLERYRDIKGNPLVITANFVIANPSFEQIKRSNYQEYHFELIQDTYKRFKQTSGSFKLVKEGIDAGLLKPQYHGREHVNVAQWLKMLQIKDSDYLFAFEQGAFGIEIKKPESKRNNLMAAFDYENENQKRQVNNIIKEGYEKFNQIFQFKPLSIIAPCNIWHPDQEIIFDALGIRYIQGLIIQYKPQIRGNRYKKLIHYQGQKNHSGQHYLVRNCFFEPSTNENYDWVGECIKRCETAFLWRKPVIISMHRLNLMGGIIEKNRKANLIKLNELLENILKKWPDIEFMSSDQLGTLMTNYDLQCMDQQDSLTI
jgi:hypothetical protein